MNRPPLHVRDSDDPRGASVDALPPRALSKYDDVPLCKGCLGFGWVRIWQDGRLDGSVTCDDCRGTGAARP